MTDFVVRVRSHADPVFGSAWRARFDLGAADRSDLDPRRIVDAATPEDACRAVIASRRWHRGQRTAFALGHIVIEAAPSARLEEARNTCPPWAWGHTLAPLDIVTTVPPTWTGSAWGVE